MKTWMCHVPVDLQVGHRWYKTWANLTVKLQCSAGLPGMDPLLSLSSHCSTHTQWITIITKQALAWNNKKEKHNSLKNITLQCTHMNLRLWLCAASWNTYTAKPFQGRVYVSNAVWGTVCKAHVALRQYLEKDCACFFISIESPVEMV